MIMSIWARLKQAGNRAQADARAADFAPEPLEIYASELLDDKTCRKCADIDGHDYESWSRPDAIIRRAAIRTARPNRAAGGPSFSCTTLNGSVLIVGGMARKVRERL